MHNLLLQLLIVVLLTGVVSLSLVLVFNQRLLPTIDEDPAIPTSSYGISKAVTEDLARHMHRAYGTTFVGLRFSNIFYDTPGHVTGYDRLPREQVFTQL